jgi:hypothetical protein
MLICDEYISEQLKYTDVFSLFLILQLPIAWTIIVYVQLKVNLILLPEDVLKYCLNLYR